MDVLHSVVYNLYHAHSLPLFYKTWLVVCELVCLHTYVCITLRFFREMSLRKEIILSNQVYDTNLLTLTITMVGSQGVNGQKRTP